MEQLVDLDKINILLHLSDDLNFCLSKVDIFFSKFKNDDGKYFQYKNYILTRLLAIFTSGYSIDA